MKFDKLIQNTRLLPCFDLSLICQLSGEKKRQVSQQLHHWIKQKRIISLRRGLYTLAENFRASPISAAGLAGEIYKPSYLSGLWALSYYGLIPEKVTTFTSSTSRVTRSFKNALGHFTYSSLKKDFFWGFSQQLIDKTTVWIAEPEKAILDYWHLNHGKWSIDRLSEMRFQNLDQLNFDKLNQYATKWNSPRLQEAAQMLIQFHHENQKGYKEI